MNKFKNKFLAALAMGAALTAPALANTLRPQEPLAQMQAEHVMLATPDYDETLTWYEKNLGFRVKHEWTVPEFPDL